MSAHRATVSSARQFVASAALPGVSRDAVAVEPMQFVFDTAKNQAAVVGSEIVSFVSGVTPERRESIVNSSLLAQLVAKHDVRDPDKVLDWYKSYFNVLSNIGWVIQESGFSEYKESSENFDAHKAIISVASVLLGPSPTALAIVTSTLSALQSMDESSPWITIFSRETQAARAAKFQISLAEQDAAGQFYVNSMAFMLEAESRITQVLFFKAKKNEVKLTHVSGKVTINTTVLDGIKDDIKAKLVGHASNYVRGLPDF